MLDELASEMKLTSPELLKLMGLGAIPLNPNAIGTPDRTWLERYYEIFSPKYMSLPSGDPRQWQTSLLELNPNVEQWGFEEFVYSLITWPWLDVEPCTKGQVEAIRKLNLHYTGISLNFQVNSLGHNYFLSHPKANEIIELFRVHYDFSQATLTFCRQIYPFLELAQYFSSPENLWYTCEYSRSLFIAHQIGLTGKPQTTSSGRIVGKTTRTRETRKFIKHLNECLKTGFLPENDEQTLDFSDYDPNEFLIGYLLRGAVHLANENNDENLENSCEQYIKAISHYNQSIKDDDDLQIPYLASWDGELQWTGKNKSPGKPERLTKKRPKGRPPKKNS